MVLKGTRRHNIFIFLCISTSSCIWQFTFVFLDNGKIALIPVLTLKEATTNLALTSMKVTTKYNHRPESTIIRSAQTHTDKLTYASEVHTRTPIKTKKRKNNKKKNISRLQLFIRTSSAIF
jgi:hypothetical protein